MFMHWVLRISDSWDYKSSRFILVVAHERTTNWLIHKYSFLSFVDGASPFFHGCICGRHSTMHVMKHRQKGFCSCTGKASIYFTFFNLFYYTFCKIF